jgi:hypothetical protein
VRCTFVLSSSTARSPAWMETPASEYVTVRWYGRSVPLPLGAGAVLPLGVTRRVRWAIGHVGHGVSSCGAAPVVLVPVMRQELRGAETPRAARAARSTPGCRGRRPG